MIKVIVNKNIGREDRQANEQERKVIPNESWTCSMEKSAYMPKKIDILNAFEKNEENVLEEPVGDQVMSLEAKVLATI